MNYLIISAITAGSVSLMFGYAATAFRKRKGFSVASFMSGFTLALFLFSILLIIKL